MNATEGEKEWKKRRKGSAEHRNVNNTIVLGAASSPPQQPQQQQQNKIKLPIDGTFSVELVAKLDTSFQNQ